MRSYRRITDRDGRSDRNLQIIRELRSERRRLQEDVKQLTATVEVYRELLRRAENAPFVQPAHADVTVS
jgi:hypothetical protein